MSWTWEFGRSDGFRGEYSHTANQYQYPSIKYIMRSYEQHTKQYEQKQHAISKQASKTVSRSRILILLFGTANIHMHIGDLMLIDTGGIYILYYYYTQLFVKSRNNKSDKIYNKM